MRIKYLDRDYRHRARVCVCVRVYVYVRVHIHIHTRTCASVVKRFSQNSRLGVSSGFGEGVCLADAWWGRQNAQFYLGERNCSAGKIVGRNPDDSGQVTVNQRTTTPLFKVIIRDS